jgi:TolB-like protein
VIRPAAAHLRATAARALAPAMLLLAAMAVQAQEGLIPSAEVPEKIAKRAAVAVAAMSSPAILVLPFPYADGVPSAEGALIAERISTALSGMAGVRLVDRTQLDTIMAEQRLSASGLVNPESAVKVGQLLGASAIVSGTVTDLGENLEIHTRVIATESGEVLSQHALTTRKAIKTFISPLWSRIEEIRQQGESFKVELWCDAGQGVTGIPARRIGETLALHFRASKDCYVTLFDFTTSGSIHVLFPNAFMRDNRVRAGRIYSLPTPEAGFNIRVQGPPGVEKLKLFATTADIPLFEHDFAKESFRSVGEEDGTVTRDLEIALKGLEQTQWAETHLEILIEQTLRAGE